MRELAIDFGTSNTVAAVRTTPGTPGRLLTIEGWPLLPSAVWLAPDQTLVVGREAERQARLDPSRYEPNPKQRIDDVEVLLGSTVVPVTELIAAVLRRVADEATRQLGGPPDRVVLTHPADWHRIRCNTLRAAARAAGFPGPVQLLAEPVAAAAHFAGLDGQDRPFSPGQSLAVYDMGGGTTDIAVVQRTEQGWQVLAEAGLTDIGGRDVDHALLEHIRRTVGPDRPEWDELLHPTTPRARRTARALADDIRAGKEALSRYAQTDIPLPEPLPDAHVTREELEQLVRPHLERTVSLLSGTIAAAGLSPQQLTGIYLVGGATRMPLVAQLIAERLGVVPTAVESPETSVAMGALITPVDPDFTDPAPPPTSLSGWSAAGTGIPSATPPGGAAVPTAPGTPPGGAPIPPAAPPGTGAPDTGPPQLLPHFPGPGPATPPQGTIPPPHQPPAGSGPTSPTPGGSGGRRRLPVLAAGAVGLVVVALVLTFVLADHTLSPADPTGDGGTTTAAAPNTTTTARTTGTTAARTTTATGTTTGAAQDKESAFGDDTELRTFAGDAVDRATSCSQASLSFPIGAPRTVVECTMDHEGLRFDVAFVAGRDFCEVLPTTLPMLGQSVDSGSWSGRGYSGSWHELRGVLSPSDQLTIWTDSGEELCGLASLADGQQAPEGAVREFWDEQVRPR